MQIIENTVIIDTIALHMILAYFCIASPLSLFKNFKEKQINTRN